MVFALGGPCPLAEGPILAEADDRSTGVSFLVNAGMELARAPTIAAGARYVGSLPENRIPPPAPPPAAADRPGPRPPRPPSGFIGSLHEDRILGPPLPPAAPSGPDPAP